MVCSQGCSDGEACKGYGTGEYSYSYCKGPCTSPDATGPGCKGHKGSEKTAYHKNVPDHQHSTEEGKGCVSGRCDFPYHKHVDNGRSDTCYLYIAICQGHCGEHQECQMDMAVVNSWKGLMLFDNFKQTYFLTAKDFEQSLWTKVSSNLWTMDIWQNYWEKRARSWFRFKGPSVRWVIDHAIIGSDGKVDNPIKVLLEKITSTATGLDGIIMPYDEDKVGNNPSAPDGEDAFYFKGWYAEDYQGDNKKPRTGYRYVTLPNGMEVKQPYTYYDCDYDSYATDANGDGISDRIWEELTFLYGDEVDRNRLVVKGAGEVEGVDYGTDWSYADEVWASVPMWAVYFPSSKNYVYEAPKGKPNIMDYKVSNYKGATGIDTSDDGNGKDIIVDTPPEGFERDFKGGLEDDKDYTY